MLRSMYSGISGLKNFQTKLDVIGNNIANVNTFGFKKGRVTFKDMMSQTISGTSAQTATTGGVNGKQVGLGSQIAAIDTITTGGNLQSTGRILDLAISGDGYFTVANANPEVADDGAVSENTEATNIKYTRAGNLYLDNNGVLVNSDGLYVMGIRSDGTGEDLEGYAFDEDYDANGELKVISIPTTAKDISIGPDGIISYIVGQEDDPSGLEVGELAVAGRLVLTKFANAGGLQKVGNNLYQATSNSGNPVYAFSGQSGTGSIESGMLEMSNVDLSEEFTEMIVAQRGFQANTRIITTSDEILQELVNLKR